MISSWYSQHPHVPADIIKCWISAKFFPHWPQISSCHNSLLCICVLTELCNSIAKYGYCHNMFVWGRSSVCLSVMRMYCDKTIEAKITHFLLKSSDMSQLIAWLTAKFEWGPLNWTVGTFSLEVLQFATLSLSHYTLLSQRLTSSNFCSATHASMVVAVKILYVVCLSILSCVTCILWQNKRTYCRYFDTVLKWLVDDVPFHLKYALKVTH